jgi:hypothetical protein
MGNKHGEEQGNEMGLTVSAGPRRERREGERPGAGVVSAATHSDLTKAEHGNVRTALAFLRARCGGLKPLAKALRLTATTLRATATPTLAYRVARLASVGVDGVLTGKYRRHDREQEDRALEGLSGLSRSLAGAEPRQVARAKVKGGARMP